MWDLWGKGAPNKHSHQQHVKCKVDNHASWSRECPTFTRRCCEFNLKHPENSLPYYPSMEPWTWAEEPWQEPTQTYRPASPPPIRVQPGTQRLRQQELNFATRSNAVPVALSQGSIRQWGNPDPGLLLGQQ